MTKQSSRKGDMLVRIFERCKVVDKGFIFDGKPSPCFLWQGGHSGTGRGGGYGRISIDGVTCATHIVVFTNTYGYVPRSKQIDHLCNQRACCNPHHLELVTHKENQRRKVNRANNNSTTQNT